MTVLPCRNARRLAYCVGLLLIAPAFLVAGRVGWIQIKVDGKDWLTGATYDNGGTPPATVWRCLASNELQPVTGVVIATEPNDALRATLRGKIEIDVRYGGKAEVKELKLVRQSPTAGWTVLESDVERIGWEIGLRDEVVPPPERHSAAPIVSAALEETPWLWSVAGIGAGLLIIMILAGLLIVLLKRHATKSTGGNLS